MKIIKRNGSEVTFDVNKIENAIRAAHHEHIINMIVVHI